MLKLLSRWWRGSIWFLNSIFDLINCKHTFHPQFFRPVGRDTFSEFHFNKIFACCSAAEASDFPVATRKSPKKRSPLTPVLYGASLRPSKTGIAEFVPFGYNSTSRYLARDWRSVRFTLRFSAVLGSVKGELSLRSSKIIFARDEGCLIITIASSFGSSVSYLR